MAATVDVARVDAIQTAITIEIQVSRLDMYQDNHPVRVHVAKVDAQVAPPAFLDIARVDVMETITPPPLPEDVAYLSGGVWSLTLRKQLNGGVWA